MLAVILCEQPAQTMDLATALGGITAEGRGWIECPAARLTYIHNELTAVIATLRMATVIYIATDASQEGELIAYQMIERAGVNVPMKRLWISAWDEQSLRRAWANPREVSQTVHLFHAAHARQCADRLFAMTLARTGNSDALGCGRLQLPVLALIMHRERTIDSFQAREYFELTAQVRSGSHRIAMRYAPADESSQIRNREAAEAALARIAATEGTICVHHETKRLPPRPLYSLSGLQRDASDAFGYSPQDTLDLLQTLYDKRKAITYPRSDCSYLPASWSTQVSVVLRFLMQMQVVTNHPALAKPILRKALFDTAQCPDHHAIVPTPLRAPLEQMSNGERRLFQLIAGRFAQALLPDYEYQARIMSLNAHGITLVARRRQPVRMGWRDLHDVPTDQELRDGEQRTFAAIGDGSPCRIVNATIVSRATAPPEHYTESTLLADLKNIQRLVQNPALKQRLTHTSALGTEAIRSNIIETLKQCRLITVGGSARRSLMTTARGRQLIESLPRPLTSPGIAALWEDAIESIASGTQAKEPMLAAFDHHLRQQLTAMVNTPECPNCSRRMHLVQGSRGLFFGCSGYPKCQTSIDVTTADRPSATMRAGQGIPHDQEKHPTQIPA